MIKIGVYVSASKLKKMDFEVMQRIALEKGIALCYVDLNAGVPAYPLDFILTKLTEDVAKENERSKMRIEAMKGLLIAQPSITEIQSLSHQEPMLSRVYVDDLLRSVCAGFEGIEVPTIFTMEGKGDHNPFTRFPQIIKREVACGGRYSHDMAIIFNQEQLEEVVSKYGYPLICQPFIDHDQQVLKVFLLGNDYEIVARPSLPNMEAYPNDHPTLYFNSQDPFKGELACVPLENHASRLATLPSLSNLLTTLQSAFHLSLIGVDFIYDPKAACWWVLDVNYFPSYKGCPAFNERFITYIEGCIDQGVSSRKP